MKEIKILGTGCPKCNKLTEAAENAAKALGIEFKIEKVSDVNDILEYGVMMTPALVVDGEVRSVGSVPDPEQMKNLINQ